MFISKINLYGKVGMKVGKFCWDGLQPIIFYWRFYNTLICILTGGGVDSANHTLKRQERFVFN